MALKHWHVDRGLPVRALCDLLRELANVETGLSRAWEHLFWTWERINAPPCRSSSIRLQMLIQHSETHYLMLDHG